MWEGIQASGRPMILTVEGSPPADVITHGGYGEPSRQRRQRRQRCRPVLAVDRAQFARARVCGPTLLQHPASR